MVLFYSVFDIYLYIVFGVVVIYMEFVYIRLYKKNNLNIINCIGDGWIIYLIFILVCYKKYYNFEIFVWDRIFFNYL